MTRRGPDREQVLRRVEEYCTAVESGRRVTGRLERLAVERHIRDLVDGPARGLRFNTHRAARAVWWAETRLNLADDRWAGQPLKLEPWQVFVVAMLFGWERLVDGKWVRRFRKGYLSMARKNAKTVTMAVVALLMLLTGGAATKGKRWAPIPGAELYSAATTRDQAGLCWTAAAKMAKRSPAVRSQLDIPARLVKTTRPTIAYHEESSFFRALAADSDTLDGLNPYLAVVDELHAHKDGTLWDVLDSGMGARLDPLLIAITTAGAERDGICFEVETDSIKVLEGVYEDDSLFAFICRLDEGDKDTKGDDPFDPAVWPKANPNLGISVTLDGLKLAAQQASQNPARLNEFLRKRMNLWTSGDTTWMPMPRWERASTDADGKLRTVDLEALRGRPCYAGVDLGASNDTTSVVAVWPLDDGDFAVYPWVWVPEDSVNAVYRSPRERELFKVWVRDGLVTATHGDQADYDVVWARLLELQERYGLVDAAFDRWSAASLFGKCEQLGIQAFPFGQGYASMNPAMRFAETIIGHRKLIHGGHPVLRWMISNTATKTNPVGDIKPDKSKRTRRIDATVAMLMALGRASESVSPGGMFVHTMHDEEASGEASS